MSNKHAILSVSDKTGIVDFAKEISATHTILSNSDTVKVLRGANIFAVEISEYTGYSDLFEDGVNILHPKILRGISHKNTPQHLQSLNEMDINSIDLVVCNLNYFGEMEAEKPREDNIVDQIDIVRSTLIRGAAKNFNRVTVVVDPKDYHKVLSKFPDLDFRDRLKLASKAFSLVTNYDIEINKYLNKISEVSTSFFDDPHEKYYFLSGKLDTKLRYGENPHQSAAFYISEGTPFFNYIAGPKVSYNNILDVNAGWNLISELESRSCVIIKHRTPCGVATAKTQKVAYIHALETNKIAAYGGVVVFDQPVEIETANEIIKMFIDVIFAPGYEDGVLDILKQNENMTILQKRPGADTRKDVTLLPNGFVIQDRDTIVFNDDHFEIVSSNQPNGEELAESRFAWKVAKHSRSNAIVISKGTRTLGIGSGQTSRISAVNQAIEQAGDLGKGGVLASDGSFQFSDSIHLSAEAGIKLIITPKGSIRDAECLAATNLHGLKLVFTDVRAFKH